MLSLYHKEPDYNPNMDDFLNTKVGELIVEEYVGKDKNGARCYKCKCTHGGKYCKGETIATKSHLISYLNHNSGGTSSCGCVQKEMRENGDFRKTHELRRTRIYAIYTGIKARCYNPNRPAYKDYGGRGIKMCRDWLNPFEGVQNFYEWSMNNGYTDEKRINRIDENGDYEPSNCEWIYSSEDISNKRNNHYVDFYGMNMSLAEVSQYAVVDYGTLKYRVNVNHMSLYSAMYLPKFKNQNDKEKFLKDHTINGEIPVEPFRFVNEFNFTSENKKRKMTEIKLPTRKELEETIRNAPTAEEYWGKGYNKK